MITCPKCGNTFPPPSAVGNLVCHFTRAQMDYIDAARAPLGLSRSAFVRQIVAYAPAPEECVIPATTGARLLCVVYGDAEMWGTLDKIKAANDLPAPVIVRGLIENARLKPISEEEVV